MTGSDFSVAVFPGDGIGVEVIDACLAVLDAVTARVGGLKLSRNILRAGAVAYRETGAALSDEVLAEAGRADAILLGAMGLPEIRYPDGTEIAPQLDLRQHFELYAGVRPIRLLPGAPSPLADPRAASIDFVIVRESTEGLFASRNKGEIEDDEVARDTMVITRGVSRRLFDFAFRLAERRKARGGPGLVTCVDKANVFRSMAFFWKIFDERAVGFPGVRAEHRYVDAAALDFVRRPWELDVIVTENMFGDILSDLGAGLIGGMGMAPSGDVGDEHAVFQPCHGSAPDIMGTGRANPTAMFLSAAMMLDWLGERHGVQACLDGARVLEDAVEAAFAEGRVRPCEFGGPDRTADVTREVVGIVNERGAARRPGSNPSSRSDDA